MTANLSPSTVKAVIEQGKPMDRSARIAELERQLARVRKDIAEQERLERRWALVQSAHTKLRQELGKTLTHEEREAMMGAYLFLHRDGVDLIRNVPSNTDRGESKALEKDLGTVEALQELAQLSKHI